MIGMSVVRMIKKKVERVFAVLVVVVFVVFLSFVNSNSVLQTT